MFSRNATDSASGRRASARSPGTNEAQLKELRNKARRRLIGALALVLAAVIIVPPLFDTPPQPELREPIVVPATSSGLVSQGNTDQVAIDTAESSSGDTATQAVDSGGVGSATPATPSDQATVPAVDPALSVDKPAQPQVQPQTEPAPPQTRPAPPASDTKPPQMNQRTDDGSVALALLAGKMPESTAKVPAPSGQAKTQGNFILQVAAYTTEQDAHQRRDGLIESGVTNAYVERAQSGDKTVYRLRVGPFTTHEAAQAAQARLRALGYQNGMISGK